MRPCPVCARGRLAAPIARVKGHTLRRCGHCGFVAVAPLPSEEELAGLYASEERVVRRALAMGGHLAEPLRRRGQIVVDLIRQRHAAAHRVAEIGCSYGFGLQVLRQAGYEVKGYELSRPAVELARRELGLDVEARPLPRPEERFDAILLRHVLEHVREPDACLAALARNLASAGLLVLAVPNWASLTARLWRRHWVWVDPPQHLSYFTPRTLGLLLDRLGYRVESAFTVRGDHPSYPWAAAIGLARALRAASARSAGPSAPGGRLRPLALAAAELVDRALLWPLRRACELSGRAEELWTVARPVQPL
ncbi:MAG TPA: class I SAM-dependent methyltransferase [Chloroflexota bacterium]